VTQLEKWLGSVESGAVSGVVLSGVEWCLL